MPDTEKLMSLQNLRWRKIKCCGTCIYSSEHIRRQVAFNHCRHPKAEYMHDKHTAIKRLPCHTLACCKRYSELEVFGLDELDHQIKMLVSLKKALDQRHQLKQEDLGWAAFFFDDSKESQVARKALQEAKINFVEQHVPIPWEAGHGKKAPYFLCKQGTFEGLENINFLIANVSSE